MKRSKKIISIITIFFLVIVIVIVARTLIGNYFQKKFSKWPAPETYISIVNEINFANKINTFGTAIPAQSKSYKVEKYEILSPINFNQRIKKDEIIAKLKNRVITAPFDGVISKRFFSEDLEVSTTSILINFEDPSIIYSDVNIPEIFAPFIKIGLPVDVKVSGYKDRIFFGKIDSLASRINQDTRSLEARIIIENLNFEILPGSLLEFSIRYNLRKSLGIPDTAILIEGDKSYVFKVNEENKTIKSEIFIGDRLDGFIEIIKGIDSGEKIVSEGLKKISPNLEIKPIIK
ncbi:MAG: efflux RND transporter periplasmic adaptor subunit [Alphaproteobacteria bacterium]|nr:efflux RND transporter periplasmic adaptor subunit [Alphaproteobacteria bacterium]